MKKIYMASLIQNGMLGGWIILEKDKLIYQTRKVTVPKEIRYLELKYNEITIKFEKILCFPKIIIQLSNETYIFVVFNFGSFAKILMDKMKTVEN